MTVKVKHVTKGISPKTILAGALPALTTVMTVGTMWAVTGAYDRMELATSLVGLGSALISGLGAYLAPAGNVTTKRVTL